MEKLNMEEIQNINNPFYDHNYMKKIYLEAHYKKSLVNKIKRNEDYFLDSQKMFY